MNNDQRDLLSRRPKKIAVLIPWFQLDGTSLESIKGAFNNRNIPALFPDWLPFGWNAVFFRKHPNILVEKIVEYVEKLQREYPEVDILLFGHSLWGTEALHAANILENPRIIPITLSGLLAPVGSMAYAPHALYYGHAARICAGDDPESFILKTQLYQFGEDENGVPKPSLENNLAIVNSWDGYLSTATQAGAFADNLESPHVIAPQGRTPRHYLQGRNTVFARDIVGMILKKLSEREITQQ